MTLSAADTIQRGLVNLRANWELVFVQFLQILIATILMLVGFLPPLAVLGFTDLEWIESSPEEWSGLFDSLATMVSRGTDAWLLLLASLLLSGVIWLIAMLTYCYFQAGIYGVLMAGDRQAPVGKPRGWKWFRTFSVRDLRGWGARYLWRYFWLGQLFLLLGTFWLLVPLVIFMMGIWGESQWGPGAAFGIGCGGILLGGFSLFVLAFWFSLAQADLAREESSVRRATKQGLLVLSRRLGAVILVAILGFVVSFTLSISVMILGFFGQMGLGSGFATQLTWSLFFNGAQWLVSCLVGVSFIAILVALARSEAPSESLA